VPQAPHIMIVEARYYAHIADELAKGAVAAFDAAGASYERFTVPGAFEIPAAIRFAVESIPPLRKIPTGTSLTRCRRTDSSNAVRAIAAGSPCGDASPNRDACHFSIVAEDPLHSSSAPAGTCA